MKLLIIAFLLMCSFSMSYAETGQELLLKKEETDGPLLQVTQKYIKEKLASISSTTSDDDTTYTKQTIDFDGCKVTSIHTVYWKENDRIMHNYSTKCDMSGTAADDYYSGEKYGHLNIHADCIVDQTTYRYSGLIFTTAEKSINSNLINNYLIYLSKNSQELNKKLVKAFMRLSDICSKMKKPREKQNKEEPF